MSQDDDILKQYDSKVVPFRLGESHQSADTPSAIKIIRYSDIHPAIDTADLVENLLGVGAMSVIYGESNSGKTFWATDLAFHVANGWEWNNRFVERSGVIYCALEGTHGIRNRIAALKVEHGDLEVPMGVITSTIDLCISDTDTDALIAAIKAEDLGVPLGLIIIDTVARAMSGGNENAPDDMGALVKNGDEIRSQTGAHVMWIHHSGKDQARGARGHSSLRAATDTEIEISAEGHERMARVTKQREYECSGEFSFTLKVVELGQTKRGKVLTSCVVVSDARTTDRTTDRTGPRKRLSGHEKRAFEVLEGIIGSIGRTGDVGVPSGYSSAPEKWWRDRFYDAAMPGDEQATKQKAFRRATSALIDNRIVGMAAGRVWICRPAGHDSNRPGMSGSSGEDI